MIYLYNNELEKISVIGKDDLREFTTIEELNSQWIVEISYPFSLHKKEAEYIGFKDDNEFKLYKIINTSRSDDFIDINGIHIFFHDLKGKIIRDIRPSNKTALQVATEILKDTDWQVFSTAQGLNATNFYYISKLDAFYDLIEKWQCEFRLETYFDGDKFVKKIYLEDHISKDYGRWFEYGDKLLTVIAEENHSNVFTAFIGRGKGEETGDGFSRKIKFDNINWSVENGNPINKTVGQDYVEIKEATKLYGYPDGKPRIAVVDFDDEDDRENLLRLTYEYALENSRPKLQLKATAVDDEKVELGEVCAIIRPNLDIRYKTRIFKVKTDRLSNLQEFEFGDKIVISRSDRIRAEQKTKEKELQEIESRLEQALKNIDIDFNNEDGYNYDLKAGNKYGLPAGYYSFNKPIDENPTKVTYLGAGKVLIADEKGTDGNWKWKTAIDGTGISGSELLTNSVTANKLASDVGQGLDLSSNEYIQSIVSNNSDISDEVYKKISELNNLLEDKISESTINSLLEEINNQLNVNSTKINQNENKLEIEFNSIKAEVDNNRADLNNLTSTITSGQDEEGNSYTEWGSTGDAKVRVGANGIDIISNDQEVMSFRDGEAYAKALYVTETIGFGNHTAQKYGTKYTVFSWNGGK